MKGFGVLRSRTRYCRLSSALEKIEKQAWFNDEVWEGHQPGLYVLKPGVDREMVEAYTREARLVRWELKEEHTRKKSDWFVGVVPVSGVWRVKLVRVRRGYLAEVMEMNIKNEKRVATVVRYEIKEAEEGKRFGRLGWYEAYKNKLM